MRQNCFYHGTPLESRALKIMHQGIRPDLSTTQGLARPVAGRVYLTTNLEAALPYLLGGALCGHDLPAKWVKESRYGYLFVIDTEVLGSVQPDEDQIGEAFHDQAFSWMDKYLSVLQEAEPLPEEEGPQFYNSLWDQVQAGEYAAWIKAGHLLVSRLTIEEQQQIIAKYGNVAHAGAVRPQSVWKFDKLKCAQLLPDGANFFELAEQIIP